MQTYKLISIFNVFVIYLIALIPSFFILLKKTNYSNKKIFEKKIIISISIEIIIFTLIYVFAEKLSKIISSKTNIQNYTYYCMKILLISSSLSITHFAIPLYFKFNNFLKKSIILICFKALYFPIMFLGFIFFNTKGIYFSVPLCDILYTILLLCFYKKEVQL